MEKETTLPRPHLVSIPETVAPPSRVQEYNEKLAIPAGIYTADGDTHFLDYGLPALVARILSKEEQARRRITVVPVGAFFRDYRNRYWLMDSQWITQIGELSNEFVELIFRCNAEWEVHNGQITIEFSTGMDQLPFKMEFLAKHPPENGYWQITWCETCYEHHPTKPYHVELLRV